MGMRTGLVGVWSPWLGATGYSLLDRSGNGSHGSFKNTNATAWTASTIAGRTGMTLSLDGSNDFVEIPVSSWLNTNYTAGITYGGWVYPQRSNAYQFLFGKTFGNGTDRDFGVWLAPNINQYYAALRGTTLTSTGTLFNLSVSWAVNAWNLVLVSYSSGTLTTTINGRQAHTATYTGDVAFSASTQNVQIGAEVSNVNVFALQGQVAEVYLWRRRLQVAEHAEIYRLGPGWLTPQRQSYAFRVPTAAVKSYLFVNRGQVIGGGTL